MNNDEIIEMLNSVKDMLNSIPEFGSITAIIWFIDSKLKKFQ